MKKIIVVVADGRVEKILTEEQVEVEVMDFDTTDEEEQVQLGDELENLENSGKFVVTQC